MALDIAALNKYYPKWAWLANNPDVAPILEQATADPTQPWDDGRFLSALQSTNWWKTTSPDARTYAEDIAKDPEKINEERRQREAKVWDQSRAAGLNLDVATIQNLAQQSLQEGWSDSQLQDNLVGASSKQGYQGAQQNLGTIQSTMDQLKTAANTYMVGLDDNTAYNWALQVANGEHKAEDFGSLLQSQAKAKFSYDPQVLQQINAGFTPAQIFTQQQQTIANLLEVGTNEVNLADPKWSPILEYSDPSANGAKRARTTSETAQYVRTLADWKKTNNAQDIYSKVGGMLSQTFQGR